jgi:hypothetical protein
MIIVFFSVFILTPESLSIFTSGGYKVIMLLRVLTDANQQDHHYIAYQKKQGENVKNNPNMVD